MKPIYLDYAATAPTDPEALKAALPYYKNIFFNPSSTHILGQKASTAVERARKQCADAINAYPDEIYFTSGGTESVNWAFTAADNTRNKIVVSAIEHDAALSCAESYAKRGFRIEYVKPERYDADNNNAGTITPQALEKATDENTSLVCVMTVNNITGNIQPVKALATTAHDRGALFFTDAVQAVNAVDIDVKDSDVDLLAVSGHKFYAPKGVGFLYIKRGVKLPPMLVGGEQERGMRAGTAPVPAIVAMGVAMERAVKNKAENRAHIKSVAQAFTDTLDCGKAIDCGARIDDIVSVSFAPLDGGRLAVALSCAGVCCSVGSACSAGSATPPKTLSEMCVPHPECTVRFSFGKTLSVENAVAAAKIVNATVKKLLGKRAI